MDVYQARRQHEDARLFYHFDGSHNFIIFRGKTKLNSTAGAWTNYIPPNGDKPGVVMMLYATRESRIYAPLLLGVLAQHSLENYGELPVGSHDLSCHSFPIQKRMAEILGQLPAESPINFEDWFRSMDFLEMWSHLDESEMTELPIEKLEHGKNLLIKIVREGINGRYQPAFIEYEGEFAERRRYNGKQLDIAEQDFLNRNTD